MPAYVIASIEVTDPAEMEQYREGVGAVVAQYGGRYLAVAPPVMFEGEHQPHGGVLIEFPSVEQARAWYDSPEYAGLKALRERSARTIGMLVEGPPAE
jgi:uncharacterized protein (DUF1330 family)